MAICIFRVDLPEILVTGQGDEDSVAQVLHLGAGYYLTTAEIKDAGFRFKPGFNRNYKI